nr:MFS transporter [Saccharopolyspora sp. ASAGF58]
MGALADRVGARRLSVYGLVGLAIGVAAFFPLLNTGQPTLAILVVALTNGIAGKAFWAPYAGIMSTLFSTEMRYSGMSFSFQLAGILGGGIAPFVAASLLELTDSWVPIMLYGLVAIAVSIGCVIAVRPHDRPASGIRAGVESASVGEEAKQ